jgi:hypothetical protein
VAVDVSFSLPVLKPAQVIKGLIVAAPIVFCSFLLNSHYHFFPGHTGTNDANVSVEQATTTPKKTQPKKVKTAKAKKPAPAKVVVKELTFKAVKGYKPSKVPVSIAQTFRGSHKIYVYAAHETLQFSFDKVDLNRYYGADELTVRVAKVKSPTDVPEKWPIQAFVEDDGITIAKGQHGQPQNVSFSMPVKSPGVYLVDIATNEDVLIEHITSRQHLLAFDERVYFAEGPAYTKAPFEPLVVTTDSTTLAFSANHYPGRQKIEVNGQAYNLSGVREDRVINGLTGTTTMTIPKGDAIFSGNGLLAVSPATLIPTKWSTKTVTIANTTAGSADNVLASN